MKRLLNRFVAAAILAAGVAGMPASATASDAVPALLTEARTRSFQVSVNWKLYTKDSSLKWTSDAAEVARMKDDIGAASRTLISLTASRSEASPSQAATIDRIVPVMEEMVATATGAVEYLNRNQARLTAKEYREYLEANSDTSGRLADLVGKLVDFGNSRDKFEKAKQTIALAK